jgi:hypothetical protein
MGIPIWYNEMKDHDPPRIRESVAEFAQHLEEPLDSSLLSESGEGRREY